MNSLVFILFCSGEVAKKNKFKVPFLVHLLVERSSRL